MPKKTLYIFGGLIVLFLIFIILGLLMWIFGGEDGYVRLKRSMVSGAERYIIDNEGPESGEQMTVTLETLLAGEYVRDVDKYVDDTCTGHVIIMNNNGLLNFLPYLSCEEYKTETLSARIIKDNLVEDSDSDYESGLYYIDGQYFFRGENPNNFLYFGHTTWRIVRIDSDGNIRIMRVDPAERELRWDDKFNYERNRALGINDYKYSNLLAQLNESYNAFQEINRKRIIPHDVCIGRVESEEVEINLARECAETLPGQYISVLSASEIPMASLDQRCILLNSGNCSNFNFFYKADTGIIWTSTAVTTTTFGVIRITPGDAFVVNANTRNRYHWVLHVSGSEPFVSGTGTWSDPYVIE